MIATHRLIIEPAKKMDADFFLELLTCSSWIHYIGDRGVHNESDAVLYIEDNLIASYKKYGFGLYKICLRNTGLPIGICGFMKRDYLDHPDIGFAVLPAYEGKGYCFEAAQAVMNFGKSNLKFKMIYAITTEENKKSRHLLKKLGMQESGFIKPDEGDRKFMLFSNLTP